MAYPIVDLPVEDTVTPSGRKVRWRTRQAKPYNLPTTYLNLNRFARGTGTYNYVTSETLVSNGYTVPNSMDMGSIVVSTAVQKARERFVNRVRDRAAWAVNIAEREQAISMITNRALQLFSFCQAVRKGNFKKAAGLLGTRELASVRSASRSFAKNFLEWHFGWSPLIQDIYTSCDILSKPFRAHKASGSATESREIPTGGLSPNQWKDSGKLKIKATAKVSAFIRVTNPNLNLLAQMGLTNPAVVAWELVPFSFVVDWFVNVSEFLGQFDEFIGLALDEPYHSAKIEASSTLSAMTWTWTGGPEQPPIYYWKVNGSIDSQLTEFLRLRGLPSIELAINHGVILSISRAVTAVSLLIQKGIRA
jgi:hypothetical protein